MILNDFITLGSNFAFLEKMNTTTYYGLDGKIIDTLDVTECVIVRMFEYDREPQVEMFGVIVCLGPDTKILIKQAYFLDMYERYSKALQTYKNVTKRIN